MPISRDELQANAETFMDSVGSYPDDAIWRKFLYYLSLDPTRLIQRIAPRNPELVRRLNGLEYYELLDFALARSIRWMIKTEIPMLLDLQVLAQDEGGQELVVTIGDYLNNPQLTADWDNWTRDLIADSKERVRLMGLIDPMEKIDPLDHTLTSADEVVTNQFNEPVRWGENLPSPEVVTEFRVMVHEARKANQMNEAKRRRKSAWEFTDQTKTIVFNRAGGCCEVCQSQLESTQMQFHHVVPIWAVDQHPEYFKGVTDEMMSSHLNCQLLCTTCHHEINRPHMSVGNYKVAAGELVIAFKKGKHLLVGQSVQMQMDIPVSLNV